ncbi:hypothetical protein N7519_000255 [Penicillium mononematosum]|uniref:uncharacterized protein n=1 Tax=Penicillium mononematosum TaxID=268346 RepID=UPI0025467C9D|nr:uncharacterized protein N7519_000255 [Penicillium mononematosum]KAJ6190234.1 hypothetical protein N7519_000255 [Penicillium mononematosum]
MQISSLIGGLSAIGGLSLAQATVTSPVIEADDFSIPGALQDLGVDVSQIPALKSFAAIETRSTDKACAAACASLSFLFGSKVSDQETTGYNNFTSSFWSVQQEEVQPHCVFRPTKNTEVSTAVLLSRLTGCEFAARSGGHAAFTGASSAPGGISIWFKDMSAVTLNPDKTVASIEPGNNWLTTYAALEPYGLAVIGGRASSIGVGGFVLGGGISYHSNLYGWSCDNVESFEVVAASGLIVTASANSYPDLYWALRGGGNNFGLVTKYNMYTIPSPKMYGGARTFLETEFPQVINAWINVINNATVDGNAQQYVAFLQTQGMNLASAELTYVKNDPNPEIFKQYRNISAISDNSSAKTLVEYVKYLETENPYGLREVYWPISAALDEKFANWVVNLFYSMIPDVANVAGVQPNESDDKTVYAFVNKFMEKVIAEAKSVGVFNEYVYMNYASIFQDAVAGYGAANKAQLKKIAKKYDPREVYQTLQPGYFKLDGPPVTPSF